MRQTTIDRIHSVISTTFSPLSFSSSDIELIGEHYGLASEIYRCHLHRPEQPQSVVVKIWDIRGVGGTREVEFYNTVAPRMNARVPKCYHATTDPESGYGVIVMEDIKGIQGDCLKQLSLEEGMAVAKVLAKFHSSWWGCSELNTMSWLPLMPSLTRDSEWLKSRRALFLERYSNRLHPSVRCLLDDIETVHQQAKELLSGAPITLVHADFHLDNILFCPETGKPILLDWARVAKGPAVLDLADLLYTMIQLGDYEPVLGAYLQALTLGGVTEEDVRAVGHNLSGALLEKFITSTCGIARWQPSSSREEEIINLTIQRIQDAILIY